MINPFIEHWSLPAERILLVLADVTIKSILVVLIAGALALALRRSSAAYRHIVWRLALGALFLLPVLSAVMPSREVTAVSHTVQITNTVASDPALKPVVAKSAAPPVKTTSHVNGKPVPAVVLPVSTVRPPSALSLAIWQQILFMAVGTLNLIGVALWLIGVIVFALPTVLALLRLPCLARPLLPLAPEQSALADAAMLAAVPNRAVRVRIAWPNSEIRVPMTWGVWRPVVALPAEADGWSEERLRAALLHEMAHVRRGDWLTQVMASFACSLYWFNPLVWIAARLLRGECERAADDFAVTHGLAAPAYAGHLLEIALALRNRRHAPRLTVPMVRQSRIEARLRDVLSKHPRQEMTARSRAAMLAAAACVLLAGSAFRFSSKTIGNLWVLLPTLEDSATAQIAPSVLSPVTLPNGAVIRLAGVVDTQAKSPRAWAADGSAISTALPKNTLVFPNLPAGAKDRALAFEVNYAPANQPRLTWVKPPSPYSWWISDTAHPGVYFLKPETLWDFALDDHTIGLEGFQEQDSQRGAQAKMLTIYPRGFPHARVAYTVKLGTAAGPSTETVQCPKTPGATHISTPLGEVIFTLLPNPHHLSELPTMRPGDAVLLVTDYFRRYRDPLGAQIEYERSILALDRSGRVLCEIRDDYDLIDYDMKGEEAIVEQGGTLPKAVLANVASFRLLVRPYQWAEFRDVQLQPNAKLSALRRAVQSDPRNAEAQYQLAQALYSINDKRFVTPRKDSVVVFPAPPAVPAEAIEHLRKAVELQPENSEWKAQFASWQGQR